MMTEALERKLQHKLEENLEFVPKPWIQPEMLRWFCDAIKALASRNEVELTTLNNGLRKGIWDTIEAVDNITLPELKDSKVQSLIHEIVRMIKFRAVSYRRTTQKVVAYTRTAIAQARKMARALLHKQDAMSREIVDQGRRLEQEKLGQLPLEEENDLEIQDISGNYVFGQAQDHPEMKALKEKAKALYVELRDLQTARVQAILRHERKKVQVLDAKIRKLETAVRALRGARQYLSEMPVMPSFSSFPDTKAVLDRLVCNLNNRRELDCDLYRAEIKNQIESHTSGLALYLGLQVQKEIAQLAHDLVKAVCHNAETIFKAGQEEVRLLNEEIATMHRTLLAENPPKSVLNYIKQVVAKYRVVIAKDQLQILALFDNRK